MAAPTVVGVGAVATGTAAITPAFPVETLNVDDILIGIGESVGNEAYTVPSGWAHVLGSPVNVDTSTRLTVIWRRRQAGDTALSWGDSGNHNVGRIIAIRGAKATGNPWDVSPVVSQETAANTSAEFPTLTTGVVDCLIVLCIATGRDISSTANLGTVTNTALSSITERMDNWTSLSTGGGIGMVTGIKATAGAVGISTAVMGSTDAKALMTIALAPAGAGGDATATPAVVACTTSVPRPAADIAAGPVVIPAVVSAPQVSAGVFAVATPAVLPAVAALVRPAANVGAGPAVLPAVVAVIRPAGNVQASSAVLVAAVTLAQPAANVGAGPATVLTLAVLPQATPVAQSGATVQPTTVAGIAALARPAANVQAGPAVLVAVVIVPQAAPVVAGNATAQPAAVATVTAVIRPAVNTATGPVVLTVLATVPQPGAGVATSPAAIATIVALPQAVAFIGEISLGAMTVIGAVTPQPAMAATSMAYSSMSSRPAVAAGMSGSGD